MVLDGDSDGEGGGDGGKYECMMLVVGCGDDGNGGGMW